MHRGRERKDRDIGMELRREGGRKTALINKVIIDTHCRKTTSRTAEV